MPCGFCASTGACPPCAAFATAGRCRHCRGNGTLPPARCFNCLGTGVCVACAGDSKCDACGGAGRLEPLGWKRPQRRAEPNTVTADRGRLGVAAPILWEGQRARFTEPSSRIFRAEGSRLVEVGTAEKSEFTAASTGSYVARTTEGESACFEVLQAQIAVEPPAGRPIGPQTVVRGDFRLPAPIRSLPCGWTATLDGKTVNVPGGAALEVTPSVVGRLRVQPYLDVPEFGRLPGPRSFEFPVVDLRIAAAETEGAAGEPMRFTAAGDVAGAGRFEWSAEGPTPVRVESDGPDAELRIPQPGRYRVTVQVGACRSAPVEVRVLGAEILDADGKPVRRLLVSLLENSPEKPEPAREPERFRVRVAHATEFTVRTLRRDGSELQPPVLFRAAESPDLLLVGESPGNGALEAVVGGRVEVRSGARLLAYAPVTSDSYRDLGIEAVAIGCEAKSLPERLEAAARFWAPAGVSFVPRPVVRRAAPSELLLVHGAPSGVDERCAPAELRLAVGETLIRIPLARKGSFVDALKARLGEEWICEEIRGVFARDPSASVLRFDHRGGRRFQSVECLDTGLGVERLEAGREVSAHAGVWTRHELAWLLGVPRSGEPVRVLVVPELRSRGVPVRYKVYPERAFETPVRNTVLISESSLGLLERALGELLLPAGYSPAEPRSVFRDPPGRRIGSETARRVRQRALEIAR